MNAPLIGTDNNVPLMNALTLSLSARREEASDYGDATVPRIGLTWDVNPALRLRAAWGESFRGPTFDQLDASGDSALLDTLIGRLAPLGVITLAGFYSAPLSFSFPPAFMREARISISAEWRDADLRTVTELIENGSLSLEGLITHRCAAADAPAAYQTAFTDPDCLKMILDWRACS